MTSSTYIEEVLVDNPVVALSCNETTGTVLADASGNGNNGAIVAPYTLKQPPLSAGLGYSIKFAVNGYLNVPWASSFTPTNDYSIEIVGSATSGSTYSSFAALTSGGGAGGGPNIYLGIFSANDITFREKLTNGPNLPGYADGVVRHYVFCRRGTSLEAWVDGILIASVEKPALDLPPPGYPFNVMNDPSAGRPCIGSVDEFAYYTHALDPARILLHSGRAYDLRTLSGLAKLDTGARASIVLVRDWVTHAHVRAVVPSADGSWSTPVVGGDYEVTFVGPVGYQPVCHGPIAAVDG